VELALSMLVIIPVFLYALFLDDLLRHVLDAQETTLSTIWDYTVQDYAAQPQGGEAFAGFGLVQGYARQMYCDHESGIDSYDGSQNGECGDREDHHQELVSHACWLNPGSQQVQCTLSSDVGDLGVSQHQSYKDEFGRGGLIQCSARLGVQNYLLQRKVFGQFSKVDLAKDKKDRGAGIHANAQGGTAGDVVEGDVYLLPWERIAIVTDTWALTEPADIRPGTAQGDLYERVLQQYQLQDNPGFTQMQTEAVNFVQEAIQEELLAPELAITDSTPPGDDPRKPSLAIKPHQAGAPAPEETLTQQGSSQGYFNSEWKDWDQDNNERSYGERGDWYMGCQREESC
jgi:hypothetical protein